MDQRELQKIIGVEQDGKFGPKSRAALLSYFTNSATPGLSHSDLLDAAYKLNVSENHIRAVRMVEAPRGAYDDQDRPSILYERHVFARNTEPKGKFNANYPSLSNSKGYGPGGYGKFSEQYEKLGFACALDVDAAFAACSWGAFQILGENAVGMGYASPFDMARSLISGQAAHLECFVRFIKMKKLDDELRACKPNDPQSCVPFVTGYNGSGYATFNYHNKFAKALASV